MKRQITNRFVRHARGALGPYTRKLSSNKFARAVVRKGSIVEGLCPSPNRFPSPNDYTTWTTNGAATVDGDVTQSPSGANDADKITIGPNTVDQIFITLTGFPATTAVDLTFYLKAITNVNTLKIANLFGEGQGRWDVDLSMLSMSGDWELVTETSPYVNELNQFITDGSGQLGIAFERFGGEFVLEIYAWCAYAYER